MRRRVVAPVLLSAAVLAVGCENAKSSNPTSPSVAGPIPGVSITTPKLLEPVPSQAIITQSQPVTLLIENASSNGQRSVYYRFEVASDSGFGSTVFVRDGVEPGSGGRTSLKLPDALASDRTYYWRAKAYDGANASAYSDASAFSIVTPAVIGPPQPLAPVGGGEVSSRRPEFVIANASRSGPVGNVSYVFEIARSQTFADMVAVVTVAERSGQTRFTINQDLAYQAVHYWRVRAFDSQTTSDWSATQSFRTPSAPVVTTPTPPNPPMVPGGAWPSNGPAVAAFVEERYPERLVPTSSLDERQNNMAFLRDRMIEAGICGGMDLALNLKRGGPDISIDFLTHRKNGTWVGVDIGLASKVYTTTLHLQWSDVGPDGVFPKTYLPRPGCR